MAYIGSTPTTQSFIAGTDYFNGTGSAVNFTLSRAVNSVNDIEVIVNNVEQIPSGYVVSGTTLTFSTAPSAGTSNVYVRYLTTTLQSIAPGQGTVGTNQLQNNSVTVSKLASGAVSPAAVSDQNNTSTGYLDLPVGTTAERPGSPAVGMIRYNTTEAAYEVYGAAGWKPLTQGAFGISVEYLSVAGGGAGGYGYGGGGGAGGAVSSTAIAESGVALTVTIGAGASAAAAAALPVKGSNTTVTGFTLAVGGGGGNSSDFSTSSAIDGGSGGGGTGPSNLTGGSGTFGQGTSGGTSTHASPNYPGGGGGGATVAGGTSTNTTGGAGGAGLNWQSLGTTYAGGGGGGLYSTGGTIGVGGAGGGGAGGSSSAGVSGTANTGGGGGGGSGNPNNPGGSGGSGIVIIRYLGATSATGGTITSAGGYTYHTFTSSGTFTAT